MRNFFDGPAFDRDMDGERLSKQQERIKALMLDGEWRTLSEIAALTNDPEASVSAQLRHLRKPRFGSYIVERRRRGAVKSGCWEYRCQDPKAAVDGVPAMRSQS